MFKRKTPRVNEATEKIGGFANLITERSKNEKELEILAKKS